MKACSDGAVPNSVSGSSSRKPKLSFPVVGGAEARRQRTVQPGAREQRCTDGRPWEPRNEETRNAASASTAQHSAQ